MPSLLPRFAVLVIFIVLANSALADVCYVIGDTSNSFLSEPVGSRQNPYGSLADVQSNPDCETITVVYSDEVLDGGIVLRNG